MNQNMKYNLDQHEAMILKNSTINTIQTHKKIKANK